MVNGLTSNTRAQVKVTLEVFITDNWGPECTVDQIHKQAIASALQKLIQITNGGNARIVGDPLVTMILVEAK